MNPERDIFAEALEIASPEERAAFVRGACRGDETLLGRIETLLADHGEALAYFPEHDAARETVPVSEGAGSRIGRYKLLQKVGEGGFGIVYMAEQREPVKRRVALKIIKLGMDTKQVVGRFEAERQALAMMDHPSIAKVLDAGATDTGRPYFVMELVRGVSITKFCDEERLTTGARIDLFLKVCAAVQHAHQKGIIHRDLKPGNVLVAMQDDEPVAKIIDFGIAKATQHDLTDKTVFTRFEDFIGTPAYMSPEQMQLNTFDIDTRSDIYALGVILYELLAGSPPFSHTELTEGTHDDMRRRVLEEQPPRPSTRVSSLQGEVATTLCAQRQVVPSQLKTTLRGDLDSIVMKALEKDRSRRYESAAAFARDLKRFQDDQPIEARPPSLGYRLSKFYHRRRGACFGAAAALVALALGAIGLVHGLVEAHKGKTAAETSAAEAEAVAEALVGMILEGSPYQSGDYSVHQMLLDYEHELSEHLHDYPAMEAKLRAALGNVLVDRSELGAAEETLKQALALAANADLGQVFEISTRELLANVYQRQRQRNLANHETKRVLDLKAKLYGDNHPETLRSRVFWIATMRNVTPPILSNEEILAELESVAERVKDRAGTQPYADVYLHALYIAITATNRLGQFEKSERYCHERLALQEKIYADQPDHPVIVSTLQHKAEIARLQGKIEASFAAIDEAKQKCQRWFGNRVTPESIDLEIEVAKTFSAAQDFNNMEQAARHVVALAEAHLENGHPFVKDGALMLAHALRNLGRIEEAKQVMSRYQLEPGE